MVSTTRICEVLGAAIFFFSYLLLLPGLLGTHFTFDYFTVNYEDLSSQVYTRPFDDIMPDVVSFSMRFGIWTVSRMLWETDFNQPVSFVFGCCIFVWGMVLPFVKLAVVVLYVTNRLSSLAPLEFVQRLSKWAMADALIPLLWITLFNSSAGAVLLQSELQINYFLFAMHVVLSIIGVLLLKLPEEKPEDSAMNAPSPENEVPRKRVRFTAFQHLQRGCLFILVLIVFAVSLKARIIQFYTAEALLLDKVAELSVADFAGILLNKGHYLLGGLFVTLVMIFPAFDYVLGCATLVGYKPNLIATYFFEGFAMFDVVVASIVTCKTSAVMFFGSVNVELLWSEYVLAVVAGSWAIYTLMGRPSRTAFFSPSGKTQGVPSVTT